jgi:hypothetical protein
MTRMETEEHGLAVRGDCAFGALTGFAPSGRSRLWQFPLYVLNRTEGGSFTGFLRALAYN